MRTTTAVLLAAVTLTALAGCSGGGDDEKTPAAATSAEEPTSPEPEPTPTAMTVGDAYRWKTAADGLQTAGTTTVLAYEQPAKGTSSPGEGLGLTDPEWAVVEVKVCNAGPDNITASQFPWTLAFPDGTRTEVTGLNGGDLPKPEFPTEDTLVRADDCLRGKIPFAVERGVRPERVVYAPAAEPEPVEWTVPAK